MTHDSAVRIVVGLVPEIEKKGAEAVLTDYAKKEDLPPAQLEKLAQVLNTLMTVSHIEKAADRGSSTHLVDVPVLVTSYAIGHEPTKSARAAVSHDITHDVGTVDLLTAMRQAVAGPKPVREVVKAAAAPTPTLSHKELRDIALDLEAEAMLNMEKLASKLLRSTRREHGVIDLSLAEEEACHTLDSQWVKRACDWLQAAAGRNQVSRYDHSRQLTKRAFVAGVRGSADMIEFVRAFVTRDLMAKAAMVAGDDEVQPGAIDVNDLAALMQEKARAAAEEKAKADAAAEEQTVGTEEGDGEEAGGGDGTEPVTPRGTTTTPRGPRGGSEERGGSKSNGKTVTEESVDPGAVLRSIGEAAMVPVQVTANAINNTAVAADRILSNITSKERFNKDQKYTDVSVEDIRRSINLSRMIGTDPVLREADPRQVLEVYNAIARTNPELANNMPAIKLLLREAVSYEGLTLDAQKQLADIRKSTVESESKEQENDKRRYSTGSIAPLFNSRS